MFAILSFIKFLRMKFTLTASFVLFDFSVLTYFFVLSFNVKFQFEWAKFKKIISAKKKKLWNINSSALSSFFILYFDGEKSRENTTFLFLQGARWSGIQLINS